VATIAGSGVRWICRELNRGNAPSGAFQPRTGVLQWLERISMRMPVDHSGLVLQHFSRASSIGRNKCVAVEQGPIRTSRTVHLFL